MEGGDERLMYLKSPQDGHVCFLCLPPAVYLLVARKFWLGALSYGGRSFLCSHTLRFSNTY